MERHINASEPIPTLARRSTLREFFSLELRETLLARWFLLYCLGFAFLMGVFFLFGLAESQVLGFHGLGRLLLTFIQASMVILPIFILITTARTLVGDRESGVWEYMLSLPVSLAGYYWGRFWGRLVAMATPLVAALWAAACFEQLKSGGVPWDLVGYYSGLTVAMVACFLGMAMLISILSASQESALGMAFGVWLSLEALVDGLLLGVMIRQLVQAEVVMTLALFNPVQAFRTAAVAVFDPEMSILGPLSYALLEVLGRGGVLAWAIIWPSVLGLGCATVGFLVFRRSNVV